MTTTLAAPARPAPGARRRVLALASAETRLLLRNRTAVVNSLLMPLLLVAAVRMIGLPTAGGPALVVTALGVTLVFLTYYNLVTTFVARREELVLQRMRTGELTGPEILLGTAVPTLLVTVVQVALVALGVAVLGEWTAPVDVVLPLLALVVGAALMVVLAAASTSFTRTAESAQITTLPLVLVATSVSGLFFPLSAFPAEVAGVLRFLPLSPVVELARLGLLGETLDGQTVDLAGAWSAGLVPLAVLAGWTLVGGLVAARVFRWAPRR
ncbi:ABC transporter permease [Geodermatophilus sabuli]|uniref:ABC transporter permease n=1 Tax=Geodermatophilus sabuli TaxID=1564158 RepID=A0A7K3W6E7_9ACTN|nr:ABC transporter permease [Geodermatophilus sabuli]NEK59824.1 ABC transporter permease [Geodermatophilus sabuli]